MMSVDLLDQLRSLHQNSTHLRRCNWRYRRLLVVPRHFGSRSGGGHVDRIRIWMDRDVGNSAACSGIRSFKLTCHTVSCLGILYRRMDQMLFDGDWLGAVVWADRVECRVRCRLPSHPYRSTTCPAGTALMPRRQTGKTPRGRRLHSPDCSTVECGAGRIKPTSPRKWSKRRTSTTAMLPAYQVDQRRCGIWQRPIHRRADELAQCRATGYSANQIQSIGQYSHWHALVNSRNANIDDLIYAAAEYGSQPALLADATGGIPSPLST